LRVIRRPFFREKFFCGPFCGPKVRALGAGRGLPMARPSHLGQLAALPSPAHALILSPCASLQSPLTRKRTAGSLPKSKIPRHTRLWRPWRNL